MESNQHYHQIFIYLRKSKATENSYPAIPTQLSLSLSSYLYPYPAIFIPTQLSLSLSSYLYHLGMKIAG